MNDLSTDDSMTIRDAAQQLRDFVDQLDRLADKTESLPIELCVVCSVRVVPIVDADGVGKLSAMVTPEEAAARLSISPDLVRGLVRCGALDGRPGPRKVTVCRAAIDAFLTRGQDASRPDPLLTMTEASRWLGIDRSTLYNLRTQGHVETETHWGSPFVRLSRMADLTDMLPKATPQNPSDPAK